MAKAKTKAKAKPKTKTTAKPKTKAKPKQTPAMKAKAFYNAKGAAKRLAAVPPDQLAKLAMAGKLEAIEALWHQQTDEGDELAYKWLTVAEDFGHKKAAAMISDVLELSSLRYDDDQFVTGNAHFELGIAYLTAAEGLPRDDDRARDHLVHARKLHFPDGIQDGKKLIAAARKPLDGPQRAVFDAIYDGKPPPPSSDDGGDDYDE